MVRDPIRTRAAVAAFAPTSPSRPEAFTFGSTGFRILAAPVRTER